MPAQYTLQDQVGQIIKVGKSAEKILNIPANRQHRWIQQGRLPQPIQLPNFKRGQYWRVEQLEAWFSGDFGGADHE
jgi:hypothetical protein